ncbi:MAG: galactokinase [Myxococcaceae bacterium]|nr:MAG: galactokinase [Myxococcaceae bacterium]
MLITRTPLRISIGGGGTDLPSYYERFGGFVIAGAINRYIYVSINRTFTDDYFLKYSALERVRSVDEIQHAIIRQALKAHPVGPGIEVVSMADIPSGTGLGSSGAFTVGLLRALHAFQLQHVSAEAVAEEACRIEIEELNRAVGKQDQYIAAHGGLACFYFTREGVRVEPLRVPTPALQDLEEHLLMFFTGYSRDADQVLLEQKEQSEKGQSSMIDNLHFVKELGFSIRTALEAGDSVKFGRLMHEHWLHKTKRSSKMSNDRINRWYQVGVDNGAVGGKLVGAGGGGFLLFYAADRLALRQAMAREGLTEVRFTFDHDGAVVIARN